MISLLATHRDVRRPGVPGIATGRDVEHVGGRREAQVRETGLRLRQDRKALELPVTLRMGAMLAGTIAILGELMTLN